MISNNGKFKQIVISPRVTMFYMSAKITKYWDSQRSLLKQISYQYSTLLKKTFCILSEVILKRVTMVLNKSKPSYPLFNNMCLFACGVVLYLYILLYFLYGPLHYTIAIFWRLLLSMDASNLLFHSLQYDSRKSYSKFIHNMHPLFQ